MENKVNKCLSKIFFEIDNIKDMIYEEIKDRHFNTTNDIAEAIYSSEIHKIFQEFKINGKQYDINKILSYIDVYIYYEIERQISKNQWE